MKVLEEELEDIENFHVNQFLQLHTQYLSVVLVVVLLVLVTLQMVEEQVQILSVTVVQVDQVAELLFKWVAEHQVIHLQ